MSKPTADPVATSSDLKDLADGLSRRVARLRRRILDVGVLRGLVPIRRRTAAARASMPEARDRERRLRAASPAYVAALDNAHVETAHLRPMTLDSLHWWVPLPAPDDPVRVARALAHQDLPYRVISQTREAAIGGVMIDIGANIGRMSIPRVILGDAVAAYCAEPDPLNYECLVRNVRDNGLAGLVLPDRVAIGASNGVVRLRRGKSTGGPRIVSDAAAKKSAVEVACQTLDTWVERMAIDLDHVTFIKVDAQGSEVDILTGAPRVLACRHIAWQIEIDLTLLAARGCSAADLYAPLMQHFTHFVDLGRHASGPRVRRIGDLAETLKHVTGGSDGRTDVVVVNLEAHEPTRPDA